MGALGDRVDRIARKQRAKSEEEKQRMEDRRIQLRRDMPEVAGFVDLVRKVSGDDCWVLFAVENGKRVSSKRARWLGIDD